MPRRAHRRAPAALAALALVPGLLVLQGVGTGAAGVDAAAADRDLQASEGYRARIVRTEYGIPHITARTWGSLGFGNGYATAESAICNLADTVLTARGERSRYLGPDRRYVDHVTLDATNLQSDTLFTDIRNRRVVEKLLADPKRGPGKQTRKLVKGYAAGVNAYLRDIGGARNITDPACRGAAWVKPNATARDIWYAVYAANLLASSGVFVPQIADAAPPSDLEASSGADAGFATPPTELPDRRTLLTRLGKDPDHPFGSNATAVGKDVTTTGRGMVLGNPHFPWRGRYRFEQAHLTIPGTYDVAGASLIGSPVVNIGWNRNVAWSHTVSTAFHSALAFTGAGLPSMRVRSSNSRSTRSAALTLRPSARCMCPDAATHLPVPTPPQKYSPRPASRFSSQFFRYSSTLARARPAALLTAMLKLPRV